jgi:hypothetical protein
MMERYVSDNTNKINSFNLEVKVITCTQGSYTDKEVSTIYHAIQQLSLISAPLAFEALTAVTIFSGLIAACFMLVSFLA